MTRRCAIYTRKSNAEGLQQEFNSLHAQREACEAYVLSQAGEGWAAIDADYDDGGWSGGSLDRPALKRLLADVEAGAVDVVMVYKIDRLSRSLADFVRLIDAFERRNVSFVSVTQAFDTRSSMGRLLLNVLLSFAQFEREMTSDRLRDKYAASRARGLWLTGPRPLGYSVDKGRLSIIEDEAALVRRMFARYPKLGSCRALARELVAAGHINHRGNPITGWYILRHLKNPLYLGDLPHRGGATPGSHEPIVSRRSWDVVQAALAESGRRRKAIAGAAIPAMLKGLIYGPTGHALMHYPVHGRGGRLYRYYVSTLLARYGEGSCPAGRFRAPEVEDAVLQCVKRLTGAEPTTADEASGLVRRMVSRVVVGLEVMSVSLTTGATITLPAAGRIGRPDERPDDKTAPPGRSRARR